MHSVSIERPEKIELLDDAPLIRIEVPGNPIPWTAPRVCRRRTFSEHTTRKTAIRWLVKSQYLGGPLTGPIFLIMYFYMPIPSSLSIKKSQHLIGTHHEKRPDCTNLQKFIEDCLSGILFHDDNQVCKTFSEKKYSENPKTVIYIQQLCRQLP